MARTYIPEEPAAYYPPRARWYAPIFNVGGALRRRLALDRLTVTLPDDVSFAQLIAGFLVPGLAVYLRGPRRWGKVAMGVSGLLALVFVVALGQPLANIAFGLMISIHATGFVYYCQPLLRDGTIFRRLMFTFAVLAGIGLALYLPARTVVQNHWLMPVLVQGRVVIVQRGFQARLVVRGDWVAYNFNPEAAGYNYHNGTVYFTGGTSLAPVLAVAGDEIVFSTNSFFVNGVAHARTPHMPPAGALTVPENHWFIWPNLDISGHGNVGEARISEALLGLANVDRAQFFGKPLTHWFGRKQILP
jgi:hypothetical protein